jgi:hypothetical protein
MLAFLQLEGTYRPVAANGDVEDEVKGRVCQGGPGALVADLGAGEGAVNVAVQEPGDGLSLPVVGGAVDDNAPAVELAVGDANRAAKTRGLVADAPLGLAAMDGSMALRDTIHLFHDINLSTHRPIRAVPHGIAQKPEGGPQPLAVCVGAHAEGGLDTHQLAGLGCEGVLGLDAARGPSTVVVLPGDQLEGLAAGQLDVAVGVGVLLALVVGVGVEGNVPLAGVGSTACAAVKGLLPGEMEAIEGWRLDGRGQGGGQQGAIEERGLHGWFGEEEKETGL